MAGPRMRLRSDYALNAGVLRLRAWVVEGQSTPWPSGETREAIFLLTAASGSGILLFMATA